MNRQLPLALHVLLFVAVGCESSSRTVVDGGMLSHDDARASVNPEVIFVAEAEDGDRPTSVLRYAEPYFVKVIGLTPFERATIRSSMGPYRGHGIFEAGPDGTIDTSRDAPLDGTYSGVESEGLLWSMTREGSGNPDSYDVTYALEREGTLVTQATLRRLALDDGLGYEDVRADGLVGALFLPEGDAPRPGVLVLGGSEGGLDYAAFSAASLAALGYAALALAYFDAPGLPSELSEIPLEYFGRALTWMGAHPEIDGARLAVYGSSRGGELALMIASEYPSVDAVIANVPSGVRWGAVSRTEGSAWSLAGQPLPYLSAPPGSIPTRETLADGSIGYRGTPVFEAALHAASPEQFEAASIPIERSEAAVLLIGGADDGLWPSCELAMIAMNRLTTSGHATRHHDELVCFEEAGHIIGTPGWPTAESYSGALGGTRVVFGGTPRGTARAERAARARIRAFLGSTLD